jgi:4'-phosphopantetheinyl transferase
MGLAAERTVELWTRRLALDVEPAEHDLSVLSTDERRRADGFQIAAARHRFVGRHVHLRQVLARYLDMPPASVPLLARLNEPPQLTVPSALRLSLSSSAGVSVAAIAWNRPVGVDVEHLDRDVDISAVAATVFSKQERQAVNRASASERQALFFRIWTRKEAFVKALGVGFMRDLKSFDVIRPALPERAATKAIINDQEAKDDGGRWLVQDVAGPSDFALACCAEGDDWTIVLKEDQA